MVLRHNIAAVEERVRGLEVEIHAALLRALNVTEWKRTLEIVATKVLREQWALERDLQLRAGYEHITPEIVATIMGLLYDSGAWFTMTVPRAGLDLAALYPDLGRAAAFNAAVQPSGPGRPTKLAVGARHQDQAALGTEVAPAWVAETHPEEQANLEAVREAVRHWVIYEKELDPERDYRDGQPLPPEELAERILTILGLGSSGRARSALMDDAREKWTGASQAWLHGDEKTPGGRPIQTTPEFARSAAAAEAAQQGEKPRVPVEVPAGWLAAVLAGWVEVVRERLPVRIERELAKIKRRKK